MWVAKWQYASGPTDRNAINNNTPSPAKKEALQQFSVVEKEKLKFGSRNSLADNSTGELLSSERSTEKCPTLAWREQ